MDYLHSVKFIEGEGSDFSIFFCLSCSSYQLPKLIGRTNHFKHAASNACFISSTMSSAFSIPTESQTKLSDIPKDILWKTYIIYIHSINCLSLLISYIKTIPFILLLTVYHILLTCIPLLSYDGRIRHKIIINHAYIM